MLPDTRPNTFVLSKLCFSPSKQFNIETRKRLLLAHAGFFPTVAQYDAIIYYLLFIMCTLTFSKRD
jgi:hypothetical protein